jgi:GT2 family glycosyltransferase
LKRHKIGILIPVHNRINHTRDCLKLLQDLKSNDFFARNDTCTIISDDASTDGTYEFVQNNYPDVIILKGDGNRWWSGGMNLAAHYAFDEVKCDSVLLWENDMIPFPGYFEALQHHMDTYDDTHILCSKIYYQVNSNKIFAMGGKFDIHTGKKYLIGRLKDDTEEYQRIMDVDWFCGQGIFIYKKVFDTIGFFDYNNFPQYHGDADFGLRAKKAGFKILVFPDLKITNDTSTTGISHIKDKNFREFLNSLVSIRSNTHIGKDIRFYYKHTTSLRAFIPLFQKYGKYIGGYFKWRILGLFGKKKTYNEYY